MAIRLSPGILSCRRNMSLCHVTRRLLLVLLVMLITVSSMRSVLAEGESIIGSREGCNEEGEVVPKENIKINMQDLTCFTCLCKNRFVECVRQRCTGQEGCYMLEQKQSQGECCRRCKGCVHQGQYHASDEEWRDLQDPCRLYHCKAGVVTAAQEVCYDAHCAHQLPRSAHQCCTPCKGCLFNGQLVLEGREVTTPDDPCLKCRCLEGRLTCSKRACPVLQCPPSKTAHVPGQCCPICRGNRSLVDLNKGACVLITAVIESGATDVLDKCTRCECMNGTSVCERRTCPVLTCPLEQQQSSAVDCCPHCPPTEESRAVCIVRGQTYEEGESWSLDSCMSCTCHKGSPRCAREMCPDTNTVCNSSQHLEHVKGECCPRCVESDGVCTVFGDPHYRTFDGKFFSFQGSCKYLLSGDCVGRSFSIRVTNDARSTKASSWTKTISLKIGDLKINLGQKMRVKINGERVKPPYTLDKRVSIEKTADSVLVKTHIGVSVLWNGNSFLEVSAPVKYKNRLCGLCGNFNSLIRDDLMTRRGRQTNDTDKLGMSWRVGGRKSCGRQHDRVDKATECASNSSKRQNVEKCILIRTKVFESCRKKINDLVYIRSCIMDMCECPSRTCHCESLAAYARECERQGVTLGDWRSVTQCPSSWTHSKAKPPLTLDRRDRLEFERKRLRLEGLVESTTRRSKNHRVEHWRNMATAHTHAHQHGHLKRPPPPGIN